LAVGKFKSLTTVTFAQAVDFAQKQRSVNKIQMEMPELPVLFPETFATIWGRLRKCPSLSGGAAARPGGGGHSGPKTSPRSQHPALACCTDVANTPPLMH
jgi:hypothetical protein